MRIIQEPEFNERMNAALAAANTNDCGWVTGPGRSGAVAAVYASHMLRIPFIPFGSEAPVDLGRALIVDTAKASGKTLRKAAKRYAGADPIVVFAFDEPPRVAFWYEAPKPQRYRHEAAA